MNLAARVADRLKKELSAEAHIINGRPGEFTVLVGEEIVSRKGWFRLPAENSVMDAIRGALNSP